MITITNTAAAKIKQLISEEDTPNMKVRAFVKGGGCSGFQYGFSFDEDQTDDDMVIEDNGTSLLIDSLSFQYLSESTIDFVDHGLEGANFIINNPAATQKCGCGSSFSV